MGVAVLTASFVPSPPYVALMVASRTRLNWTEAFPVESTVADFTWVRPLKKVTTPVGAAGIAWALKPEGTPNPTCAVMVTAEPGTDGFGEEVMGMIFAPTNGSSHRKLMKASDPFGVSVKEIC
jgi:hypothetical protein